MQHYTHHISNHEIFQFYDRDLNIKSYSDNQHGMIDLDNIISWWKRNSGKRYDKLKKDGRFRTEVELWTEDDDIQIIR